MYDGGAIYSPEVLDVTQDDLRARFMQGVATVAAVSLGIGYPTKASAPHLVANVFKRLLAVAAETEVTFKEAEKVFNSHKYNQIIFPILIDQRIFG